MHSRHRPIGNQILAFLGALVAPSTCAVCDVPGPRICEPCLSQFPQSDQHRAQWIVSAYHYKYPTMRSLIRTLKTLPDIDSIRTLVPRLGERLLDELSERQTFGFPRNIALVPIPISRSRFIERGYNQASLIAKELEHHIPKSTTRMLLRRTSRYTKQALVTNRTSRFHNQSGSMRVSVPIDPDIGYIIIDDVTTSGATLAEAKRALKAAGAKHVIAAVLAH